MPPAIKKTTAVAPYMIAIFLWSGVVNQHHTPVVARGRSSSRARRGIGTSTVVMRLQTPVLHCALSSEQFPAPPTCAWLSSVACPREVVPGPAQAGVGPLRIGCGVAEEFCDLTR